MSLDAIGMTVGVLTIIGWMVWTLSGAVEGYLDAKNRPKEQKMFWCAKHGMFLEKHVLPVPGMTTVCPICFKESWDKAGK